MKRPPTLPTIALGIIFVALIWAIITTINNGSLLTSPDQRANAEILPIQKSERRRNSNQNNSPAASRYRSFDELKQAWQNLIPAHGESLFNEQEMARFLDTLTEEEIEQLAKDLLSTKSFPIVATARLMVRWGEFNAQNALSFLQENKIRNRYLVLHTYVGWVKEDPITAFEHYQTGNPNDPQTLEYLLQTNFRRADLWETLANLDSKFALKLLLNLSSSAEETALQISPIERDTVFKKLPKNSNWKEISVLFLDRKFTSKFKELVFHEQGPGDLLFARWADQDIDSALQWSREERKRFVSEGTPTSTPGTLIASWYDESPAKASAWIETQISLVPEGEIMTILEEQIPYQLPNKKWLSWSKNLPDEHRRFEILKSAAEPESTTYYSAAGGRGGSRQTHGMKRSLIETLIPQFNLTPVHQEEIKKILETRTAPPPFEAE